MAVVLAQNDTNQQQFTPIRDLFPAHQKIQDQHLSALITDFFDWLETAWRLPLSSADQKKAPLPVPLALAEGLYTVQDLSRLYGYHKHAIHRILKRFHIFPSKPGKGGQAALYARQDLTSLIDSWELQRLLRPVDQWWLRFFPSACKTCRSCHIFEHRPVAQQIYCKDNLSLWFLRSVLTAFLEEVCR